jgi:hypothetical protein
MMTISAWLVKENLLLALLFAGDCSKYSPQMKEYAKDRYILKPGQTENYNKSWNCVIDFFSNEFAKNDVKYEQEYLYSAYYANEIYNQYNKSNPAFKLDGVQYASVANCSDGENIALSESAFKKLDFLGANSCYTYNAYHKPLNNESKTIFARDKAALLKNDSTLEWIDAENGIDYIVYRDNDYHELKITPSRGVLPIQRVQ